MKVIDLLEDKEPSIRTKDFKQILKDFWIEEGKTDEEAKKLIDDLFQYGFAIRPDEHIEQMITVDVIDLVTQMSDLKVSEHGDEAIKNDFHYIEFYPLSFTKVWRKIYQLAGMGSYKK